MRNDQLTGLEQWFERFVLPYCDTDPEGMENIRLKIEHTRRVCTAMGQLAEGERLSVNDSLIAAATALLHDVGRFPQYRRWRTFRDRDSDNHARLAIDVIRREGLLRGLPAEEQLLIEEAVRFHNVLAPPRKVKSPTRLFINLIRDADKLDIWRVFAEILTLPPAERPSAATLGFPDIPDAVSPDCIAALADGRIIRLETVRSVNDFKLLQISWIYDLGFATSRRLLAERGYIELLAATLPENRELQGAIGRSLRHLQQ